MTLEKWAQDVIEGRDPIPQLLIGHGRDVRAIPADLEHFLAVLVVQRKPGCTEHLLGQPLPGLLLEHRILVEVPALAFITRDSGHVAEVLQVDGLRRHPRYACAEEAHQGHIDVQVAAERRQDGDRHLGLVVETVVPHLARHKRIPPTGLKVVLEAG